MAEEADKALVAAPKIDAGVMLNASDLETNASLAAEDEEEEYPWESDVEKLVEGNADKRTMYFIRGDPGTNKSTWQRELKRMYPGLVHMINAKSHRHTLSHIANQKEEIDAAGRSIILLGNFGLSFDWKKMNEGDGDLMNMLEDLKDGHFTTSLKPIVEMNLDYPAHILLFGNDFPPEHVVTGLSPGKLKFMMIDPVHSTLIDYTGFDAPIATAARERRQESMRLAAGEMVRSQEQYAQADILLKCFKPLRGVALRKTSDLLLIATSRDFVGNTQDLGSAIGKVFAEFIKSGIVQRGHSNGKAAWRGLANVA